MSLGSFSRPRARHRSEGHAVEHPPGVITGRSRPAVAPTPAPASPPSSASMRWVTRRGGHPLSSPGNPPPTLGDNSVDMWTDRWSAGGWSGRRRWSKPWTTREPPTLVTDCPPGAPTVRRASTHCPQHDTPTDQPRQRQSPQSTRATATTVPSLWRTTTAVTHRPRCGPKTSGSTVASQDNAVILDRPYCSTGRSSWSGTGGAGRR